MLQRKRETQTRYNLDIVINYGKFLCQDSRYPVSSIAVSNILIQPSRLRLSVVHLYPIFIIFIRRRFNADITMVWYTIASFDLTSTAVEIAN